MTNRYFSILLLFTLALPTKAIFASEDDLQEQIVSQNKMIADHFNSLAQEIDTLLSNRRGVTNNGTTVRLIGFTEYKEGGDLSQSGHISADLRLPKLEKKWKLRFSSFDNEDEFEGLGRNRDGAAPREQKLGTSLAFVRDIESVKTTFRPRIELKNPLVSSFLMKFEGAIKFNFFTLSWRKKFFAHSIDGVGQSLAIDFDRNINDWLLFRIFNEEQYLDKDNLLNVSQGPSLLAKINDSMALSQTLAINSYNRNINSNEYGAESYHLGNYRVITSFSHKILKRVLHYQVSPYIDFSKINNFKGSTGIRLTVEIIF